MIILKYEEAEWLTIRACYVHIKVAIYKVKGVYYQKVFSLWSSPQNMCQITILNFSTKI